MCDVYQEAAAIGVISADDALRLSEGQFVADTMPFAMDVSRNGKRLRPHVELLRLCSDEEELRAAFAAGEVHTAFIEQHKADMVI